MIKQSCHQKGQEKKKERKDSNERVLVGCEDLGEHIILIVSVIQLGLP